MKLKSKMTTSIWLLPVIPRQAVLLRSWTRKMSLAFGLVPLIWAVRLPRQIILRHRGPPLRIPRSHTSNQQSIQSWTQDLTRPLHLSLENLSLSPKSSQTLTRTQRVPLPKASVSPWLSSQIPRSFPRISWWTYVLILGAVYTILTTRPLAYRQNWWWVPKTASKSVWDRRPPLLVAGPVPAPTMTLQSSRGSR